MIDNRLLRRLSWSDWLSGRYPGWVYLGVLLLVQLMLAVLVWPVGNFPTNDDWSYAQSVIWLLTEHRVRLSDWIAMNLLPQTLLGASWAYAFGFSFSGLRMVTELVALATSVALFGFFRVSGMERALAFMSTLCVVSLPWWQSLANSYMSDMYGMAFAISGSYFFVRQMKTPRMGYLIMGALLVALGVLQRQIVAVIPLAFLFGWFASGHPANRKNLLIGILPLVLTIICEMLYQGYLAHGPGIPAAQLHLHSRLIEMALGLLSPDTKRLVCLFQNLLQMAGLLGMSTVIWAALNLNLFRGRRTRLALAGLALLAITSTLAIGWLPPYRENNMLDAAGIGPFTLGNGMLRSETSIDRDKGLFWTMAGLIASVGMAFLAVLLSCTFRRVVKDWASPQRGVLVFLVAAVTAYILPFAVTDYFDRYLIFVVPFLLPWAVIVFGANDTSHFKSMNLASMAALLAIGILGAGASHDYFAWNRARWQAIAYAEDGFAAGPASIDGGFEFNGFYNFEARKTLGSPQGKQWWWVIDDQFLVSFSPKAGYSEISRFPVKRWFVTTPPDIYLLRRK